MDTVTAGDARDLFRIVTARDDSQGARRAIIAAAIGCANIILCAYCERFVTGPEWHETLRTVLAMQLGLIEALAMGIYLQIAEPVLHRTRIHPVGSRQRFLFAVMTVMRHRYMVVTIASSVFSLTMMLHPTFLRGLLVALVILVPELTALVASTALVVVVGRWAGSGALALAIAGFLACIIAVVSVVFPETEIMHMLIPLEWWLRSCVAALRGITAGALVWLAPFLLVTGVAWAGGARYA